MDNIIEYKCISIRNFQNHLLEETPNNYPLDSGAKYIWHWNVYMQNHSICEQLISQEPVPYSV